MIWLQKKYSIKLISKAVFEVFKLIFHQIQNFYDESLHVYSSFKEFQVIENSKPILEKIEKISCKANAKAILAFDFSTFQHSILNYLILI